MSAYWNWLHNWCQNLPWSTIQASLHCTLQNAQLWCYPPLLWYCSSYGHLLCLGHNKEDKTGTTIQVLTTSLNTSFTRFMDNHWQAFLLNEASYHATATYTSKFEALHKTASNEYLLFHKDGWFCKVPFSDADGFVLLTGVHKRKCVPTQSSAPVAAPCSDGETYANKAKWELLCPGPSKPLSKHVENHNWWWCTNHTNHSACTFKNPGQWVQHSPADWCSGTYCGRGCLSCTTGSAKLTMPESSTATVPASTPHLCSCSSYCPFLLCCYIWCTPQDALWTCFNSRIWWSYTSCFSLYCFPSYIQHWHLPWQVSLRYWSQALSDLLFCILENGISLLLIQLCTSSIQK